MASGSDPKSRLARHAPDLSIDAARDEPGNDPSRLGDRAGVPGATATPVFRPSGPMPSLGRALRSAPGRTLGDIPGGTRASAGPSDADRSPRSHQPVSGEGEDDDL